MGHQPVQTRSLPHGPSGPSTIESISWLGVAKSQNRDWGSIRNCSRRLDGWNTETRLVGILSIYCRKLDHHFVPTFHI